MENGLGSRVKGRLYESATERGIIMVVQPVSTIPVVEVVCIVELGEVDIKGLCEMVAKASCRDDVEKVVAATIPFDLVSRLF